MATDQSPGNQQLPAAHPKLANYIDTAAACLKVWARANGQSWEALTDPDALLLQTLLAKSRPEGRRSAVQILPLSDFKGLLNESLTERRWEKFLRWFAREISSDLAKTCSERVEPVLYPARSSSGIGGRGPKGQAIYFLSFEPPPLLAKSRAVHSPAERSTEQKASEPAAAEPLMAACTEAPSTSATEPTAQAAAGAPDDRPRSPGPEPLRNQPRRPRDNDTQLGVLLGLQPSSSNGMSVGWVFALALLVVFATSAEPTSTPLVAEIVRALTAVREALSGNFVVWF
jgi:hypothetical protein